MAIQAISRVTNRGYSNISFGKRGEKPAKNHNVTSPMKAVPLAVLIAMSPLTTTNAENIMRAESNANTIELAQNPQSRVLIYGDSFKSQNGTDVIVMALNTKGGTDSFDKILLKAGKFTFEAKDLVNREIYLYGENGVKEGPMYTKEVIGETEYNGKIQRFSFLDPQVVNYVEAVISQPTNQSNIKGVRQAHNNLIVANEEGDLLFVEDDFINHSIGILSTIFEFNTEGNEKTYEAALEHNGRKSMGKDDIYIKGSHGNYILKFYDLDNDLSNFEEIRVVHEDLGVRSTRVKGVSLIDGRLHGLDALLNTGLITAISLDNEPLYTEYFGSQIDNFIIMDDILGSEIMKVLQSPEYNKNSESAVKINQKVSNLVLEDK